MADVIIPCTMSLLRKVKSKKIVEDFLQLGLPKGIVSVQSTGRNFTQVYNALYVYVNAHPNLGVSLVREDGNIVLYRDTIGEDSTIRSP